MNQILKKRLVYLPLGSLSLFPFSNLLLLWCRESGNHGVISAGFQHSLCFWFRLEVFRHARRTAACSSVAVGLVLIVQRDTLYLQSDGYCPMLAAEQQKLLNGQERGATQALLLHWLLCQMGLCFSLPPQWGRSSGDN